MRAKEFIKEGTEIFVGDDHVFAKRSSRGRGKPPAIRMLITKDEWEQIKDQQANTERMDYDIATAEMIIKDMVKDGGEVIWKSAADWNQDARELETHRFRNDPDVAHGFDTNINTSRDNAKATAKASMKQIK